MRTIKLNIAYDGSAYHGFQKQPHGKTVQDTLEFFLQKVCGEAVATAGSGRTDAGVHALEQVVSFTTQGRVPCENIVRASRGMLPGDIVITGAEEVPEGFHARYSARWKQYCYRVSVKTVPSPFLVNYAWNIQHPLNIETMNEAAALLIGTHDFSAFRNTGSVDNNPVRDIYRAHWAAADEDELRFYIAGNGFLYHMVRNIVWSLVQVGLGKFSIGDFTSELRGGRRDFSHTLAPACGLYLERVGYEEYAYAPIEKP